MGGDEGGEERLGWEAAGSEGCAWTEELHAKRTTGASGRHRGGTGVSYRGFPNLCDLMRGAGNLPGGFPVRTDEPWLCRMGLAELKCGSHGGCVAMPCDLAWDTIPPIQAVACVVTNAGMFLCET